MTIIFGCRRLIDKTKTCNRFHVFVARAFCSGTEKGCVAKKLDEGYKPHIVEKDKYNVWEKDQRFVFRHSSLKDGEKVFSMVLPPPNITGNLHLGHALTTTLQDVIARWKRMTGHRVLFLPGTDHAGIATQVVIEKYLSKKGIEKSVVDLETILKHAWNWKEQHANNIRRQLKRLGASLDWSREVFTMDEKHTEAVQKAILELNQRGYVYRGHRLVNWSCALKSTISDMEVETLLINGPTFINVPGYNKPVEFGYLSKINYKLCDGDEKITVATTRPETILGDTAIAVHPDDERYKKFHFKHVKHPLIERTLPIIPDLTVDPNFGTGALKITPAHDKTDYEIALKYNIDVISVIDSGGCMVGDFKYSGMPRYKARTEILKDLSNVGALDDHTAHSLTLPICSRTGDVVELIPYHQWFLRCQEMSSDLKTSTDEGDLEIIPHHHKTVWYNRLESQMDWCLSRQLWWGHKLPFWWTHPITRPEEGVWISGIDKQEAVKSAMEKFKKNQKEIVCKQDSDVLDTWFSSGLYPFTSLGWPNKESNDYKDLYPLSLMVTGYDIMCLWVMRMAMLGKLLTGSLPFPKVLFHGIVTDAEGAKMSKSKGNVINPEDIINGATLQELNDRSIKLYELGTLTEKELKTALGGHKKYFPQGIPECGADALRFTLCEVNPKNQLISFNVQKCFTNKLFGNKMWQSVKYFTNCYESPQVRRSIDRCSKDQLQKIDAWLLSRLYNLVAVVNNSLETFDFHLAVDALKKFLYEETCDIYIECTKMAMKSDLNDEANAMKLAVHCHVFAVCFNTAFRCLAPFMPYLTEELIPAIPYVENIIHNYKDTLDNLSFPNCSNFETWKNVELEKDVELCMNVISVVRQLRHMFNINYKINPKVCIEIDKKQIEQFDKVLNEFGDLILFITKCEEISIMDDNYKPDLDVWSFHQKDNFKIHLELPHSDEMISKIKDAKKVLWKKREKLLKKLTKLENKVNDKKFIKSASDVSKKDHLSRIQEIKDDLQNMEQFQTIG